MTNPINTTITAKGKDKIPPIKNAIAKLTIDTNNERRRPHGKKAKADPFPPAVLYAQVQGYPDRGGPVRSVQRRGPGCQLRLSGHPGG